MSDKIQEIYNKHVRKEEEPFLLECPRYTVDGKPSCCAWYGHHMPHLRMVCRFLMDVNYRYKSMNVCGALGKELNTDDDNFVEPHENCPLWKDKT